MKWNCILPFEVYPPVFEEYVFCLLRNGMGVYPIRQEDLKRPYQAEGLKENLAGRRPARRGLA